MSTYSPNLALELIATGDQSGTWGVTTNTNLGTLIEQAISGYVTQAITDSSVATTITIPNGATGVARNMFLELTGTLTAARVLEVPSNKKLYFIYNNTSGGYAVTVNVTGQTGVSVPNGKKVLLVSNGTDVVDATNYYSSLTAGSLLQTAHYETKVAISASDINLATGNYFSKTIAATTTFTVSNVPTTGTASSFILDLTNGGAYTVNWWSGVKWASGAPPTLTTSGRDVLGFFTYDGGTTWNGFVMGRNMA